MATGVSLDSVSPPCIRRPRRTPAPYRSRRKKVQGYANQIFGFSETTEGDASQVSRSSGPALFIVGKDPAGEIGSKDGRLWH